MAEGSIDVGLARYSITAVVSALPCERYGGDQRYDSSDLTPNSPTLAENPSYRIWVAAYAHAALRHELRARELADDRVTTRPQMSTKFNCFGIGSAGLNKNEQIGVRPVSGRESARCEDHAVCTKGEELDYVAV